MKEILRSLIKVNSNDKPDFLYRNYIKFLQCGLDFDISQDMTIFSYIKDFSSVSNHVPDYRTLYDHFEKEKDQEVLDRLENVATLDSLFKGDFEKKLEDISYFKKIHKTAEILSNSDRILQGGLTIQEGKNKRLLKGPIDAVRYFVEEAQEIVRPSFRSRLSGEITKDGDSFREEYETVEADPLAGIGQFTGIEQMDDVIKGAKKGELWTHAAFTGGLKSTLMLNWAYNQAVYFKCSSLIFSLEMPYEQVRRILYTMHSYNAKFQEIRLDLDVQANPKYPESLYYDKVKHGELSRKEKEFLFDCVIPDFNSDEYGKIFVEVADPDKTDFTITDVRTRAEFMYSQEPFDVLFLDHMGLLSSRRRYGNTTESLNEVLRDAKKLSMNFNRGSGIPVVGLFQISRQGYLTALKNEGSYNLTALSYANEAEKSSDIVTTSFVDDELRLDSLVKFQCLKSRDSKLFEEFYGKVYWPCRRIKTFYPEESLGGAHSPNVDSSVSIDDLFMEDDSTDEKEQEGVTVMGFGDNPE